MMHRTHLFITLLVAAATLPTDLSGQTRHVVDAAGGAGSQFKQITAAIAAAKDGDFITVRRGDYNTFQLSKSLTILGEPGATIRDLSSPTVGSTLQNITGTATIRGLEFQGNSNVAIWVLRMKDCSGRVILRDLNFDSTFSFFPEIAIENCTAVSIDQCTMPVSVSIANTGFTATDSDLGVALTITESKGTLTRCSAVGISTRIGRGPAILVENSHVELRGDGTALGYNSGLTSLPGTIGITGNSIVVRDPDVRLGSPPSAGGSLVTLQMPWLRAQGGGLGQTVDLSIGGEPGEPARLFLALPGGPIALPGLGDAWVDPNALFEIARGVLHGTGRLSVQRQVPNTPGLLGLAVTYQSLNTSLTFGPRLTNAVTVVVH